MKMSAGGGGRHNFPLVFPPYSQSCKTTASSKSVKHWFHYLATLSFSSAYIHFDAIETPELKY